MRVRAPLERPGLSPRTRTHGRARAGSRKKDHAASASAGVGGGGALALGIAARYSLARGDAAAAAADDEGCSALSQSRPIFSWRRGAEFVDFFPMEGASTRPMLPRIHGVFSRLLLVAPLAREPGSFFTFFFHPARDFFFAPGVVSLDLTIMKDHDLAISECSFSFSGARE